MKVLDVNVLVNGFRADAPGHSGAFAFLAHARRGREPIIILPEVAVGFIRLVTRRGLFIEPDDAMSAMAAIDAWCSAPPVSIQEAGSGRWKAYAELMLEHGLIGSDAHDGLLAAACLDLDATLVTSDRGFARFDRLKVQYV